MKKLLLLLIIPFLSFGQDLTYVPDDAFELLIETTIPSASNGNNNDNYVLSSALQLNTAFNSGYSIFTINNDYGPIFDLTGIEDFSVYSLTIDDTYITDANLSGVDFNGNLTVYDNQYLEQIILPEDTLENIAVYANESLSNITFNPNFGFNRFQVGSAGVSSTDINVDQPNLCELIFQGSIMPSNSTYPIYIMSTDLYQLDFSNLLTVPYQTTISIGSNIVMIPSNISQINLNNDIPIYNWIFAPYIATSFSSPSVCVELNSQSDVDFVESNNDWPDVIGWPQTTFIYSTNCYNETVSCSNIDIIELPTTIKKPIKTLDILGRETTNQGFQLQIYDDGSVEKKYLIK